MMKSRAHLQEKCHFHAGVEHCVDDNNHDAVTCERVKRDYDIPLRIGLLLLFLLLLVSGLLVQLF